MPGVSVTGLEKVALCQPLAVSLVKVSGRQLRAGARPELAGMGAGVLAALVEPDAADGAGHRGLKLHAELDRARIRGVDDCGSRRARRTASDRAAPLTVTVRPAEGVSRLMLSSTARDMMV